VNKASHNNLVNGIACDHLNINDRSIHYGDGLFETILCSGKKIFYWQQHYRRLQQSAEKLEIACPDQQLLLDDIKKLLLNSNVKTKVDYAIKIIVSRGVGERGYKFTKKNNSKRILLLSEIEANYSSLLNQQLYSGELFICRQQVSINQSLAGIKHLNRLDNVLARNECGEDFIDGLMLNANKHVIEGTMSNIFAVKDQQLLTPDLNLSGVSGIMRKVIIDLANTNNIKTSVLDISLNDLSSMDEIFISNSLIGIKSITKIKTPDSIVYNYDKHQLTKMLFNTLLKTRDNNVQAI